MNNNTQLVELYAKLAYKVDIKTEESDGEVYFVATHPDLEGCIADGETEVEAVANLNDARYDYIMALLEWGDSVPLPKAEIEKKEQNFRVRFPSPRQSSTVTVNSSQKRMSNTSTRSYFIYAH